MQLEFFGSSNKITATDGAGTKLELKDADVLKKGDNIIYVQVTKRGYIVEVNDKDLNDFNPNDKKEAELAVSQGLDTVSVANVAKLNGKAKSLVIGSLRYQ